jgi:hypothetical protein
VPSCYSVDPTLTFPVDKNRPKDTKNGRRPPFGSDQPMDKIYLELPQGLSKNIFNTLLK